MNFLGIFREPTYSPGRHASNDSLILRLVGQTLEREGHSVTLATLAEARALRQEASLIFSMCQGPAAVAELIEWKKQGSVILNDPEASRRTYRDSLCSTLREKELGFPRSEFIFTERAPDLSILAPLFAHGPAWLKRADVHATQTGDVVRIEKATDLPSALSEFAARGLSKAVLQQHREGDEVKFYAVRGGQLFWPHSPREPQGYPFDEKELKALAEHAAEALDLSIYGGDAIISPEGHITLIDLNDWPSFAPCRGAAASAIAHYLKDAFHALASHQSLTSLR